MKHEEVLAILMTYCTFGAQIPDVSYMRLSHVSYTYSNLTQMAIKPDFT